MEEHRGPDTEPSPARRLTGLVAGLAVLALQVLEPPAGMERDAWIVACLAMMMAVWWITEAIPVYATGLLPLVVLPLTGVRPIGDAAAPYANPVIFLFMGGFLIALAMQRWNLHRRIALAILTLSGTRAQGLVGGFLLASALLSMWVSNTATAAMLLPIAVSVIALLSECEENEKRYRGFHTALLLSVAYGASIGGLATLIGTPPNALLAGYFSQTYGLTIGFAQWMLLGVPLSAVLLLLAWGVLSRVAFRLPGGHIPGAEAEILRARRTLGPVARGEIMVAMVFAATALLWLFRPLLADVLPGVPLTDDGIAITAGLLLFALPVAPRKGVFLLNWDWAVRLPWGVLILFGGGLSLASAVGETGLAEWIAGQLTGLGIGQTWILILLVIAAVVFLTELASNTATAAALLPLLAGAALGIGENPLLLAVPAALAASCAFMLPAATPPNAIVFGSGLVGLPQMARAGVWLNAIAIAAILAAAYSLLFLVFSVTPGEIPDWAGGRP